MHKICTVYDTLFKDVKKIKVFNIPTIGLWCGTFLNAIKIIEIWNYLLKDIWLRCQKNIDI